MMTFTLTFSRRVDGNLEPVMIDGREATLDVEADSKTGAIYSAQSIAFCKERGCTVRSVRT